LSSSTAKKLFGNEDPVGRQLLMSSQNSAETPTEIVGVVGDVRSQQLAQTTEIEFYRPFPQRSTPFLAIAVRTRRNLKRPQASFAQRLAASTRPCQSSSRTRWKASLPIR
jgi:hypothetical protein